MTHDTEQTPKLVDLPTGGTSTLRLAVVEDGDGGRVLIASHGYGIGEAFHRPAFCGPPLRLPASVLPQLVAALEELAEGERP